MMAGALPLVGWTLFTGVCAIPMFKGTRMLAEWLEERPDGSISKGKSSNLLPLTASALAFGALAYGFGFGGIAGVAGGATTEVIAQAFGAPSTPTVDVTVFAATGDSLFWLGSAFSADPGDTHDSTQLQIDTIGTSDWTSPVYTDSVTTALERDTVPPLTVKAQLDSGAVAKARIRYYGREGGWSAWSDSVQFTMASGITPNTPTVDVVVFAATADSLYWLGTPYVGGGSHDSTQVQIDSLNGDWTSPAFTDSTSSALERDTLPAYTGIALAAGDTAKARIRYKGDGVWSAWSDSATFSMRETLETFGSPYIDVDFEGYETIAQMDTTTSVWNVAEIVNGGTAPDPAIIDTTRGYNGRRHSLRYAFARTDSSAAVSITRVLANFAADQTDVWIEIPVRYSTDFTTDCGAAECSPGDHKLIFGLTARGDTYRWQYKVGAVSQANPQLGGRAAGINFAGGTGFPLNDEINLGSLANSIWQSGEWHILRVHWKHSVPANTGQNGVQEYWLNSDSLYAETGITNATDTLGGDGPQDYIRSIALGKTQNDGPTTYNDGVAMYLWWGYVKVYTSDPGW